jgi:hypothetical protein
VRRHHLLAVAAALLGLGSTAAEAPGAPPPSAGPHDTGARTTPQEGAADETLATLDGVVRAVDRIGHEVTIDVGGSPVVLRLDRNTLVYLPTGLSTVFALHPGDVVRAGRNAAFVAYWVQVRSSGGAAIPSSPGQGTGPGGGTAPPREGAGPGPVAP